MNAAVIAVVAGEPGERLDRLRSALAAQECEPFAVWVACPPIDRAAVLASLRPGGAIAAVMTVDNPTGQRSQGLNLAWRAAAAGGAEVVCRIDARSRPSADHLRCSVERLAGDHSLGVAGGHQVPTAEEGSLVARAIARVLGDPVAVGGASYRRRSASGLVDTVYLGSFRTVDLAALGGWSEALPVNEDYELCQRYRARGLGVWLEADLDVGYEARSDLRGLIRQYRDFGRSKVEVWRRAGLRPRPRQLLGAVGPLVVAAAAMVLAVWDLGGFCWALAAAAAGLVVLDARRGPGGLALRGLAAVLTPVPTIAFALGALVALGRRSGAGAP